jgi:hypothetical protein
MASAGRVGSSLAELIGYWRASAWTYASGVLGLHQVEYALMTSVWTNRGGAYVPSGREPLRERGSM